MVLLAKKMVNYDLFLMEQSLYRVLKKTAPNFKEELFQNYLSNFFEIWNITQGNAFVECVKKISRLLKNCRSCDYFRKVCLKIKYHSYVFSINHLPVN